MKYNKPTLAVVKLAATQIMNSSLPGETPTGAEIKEGGFDAGKPALSRKMMADLDLL